MESPPPLPPSPPDPPVPGAAAPAPRWWSRAADPRTCVLINLLAFPGLGTVLARKRWGYLQATLMVAGFTLLMGFMGCILRAQWHAAVAANPALASEWGDIAWMGWWGGALSAAAWTWAALSSVGLWREAGRRRAPRSLRNRRP